MEVEDGQLKLILVTREHVQQRAVIEVDAVGSGFMLIKRKALEAVDDYIRNRVYPAIPDEFKWMAPVPYFPVTYDAQHNITVGSDFSFCKMARRAGQKVFLDCGVVCGHQWEHEYSIEDHWNWIDRYTFNTELPPYPGAPLPPVRPPTDKIYWGDSGGPMDVTVTSVTDQERAENDVFPVLKAVYGPVNDLDFAGRTKAGYIVGFGVTDEVTPKDYLAWAKKFQRVGIHWSRDDAAKVGTWLSKDTSKVLDNGHFVHMADDNNTKEILRTNFKNVHVVPIPTSRMFPVAQLPGNFTVGVNYDSDKYDDVLAAVVKRNPGWKFKFFCQEDAKPGFDESNMLYVSTDDAMKYAHELAKMSCLVHLGDAPAYKDARMSREAAMMGRRIVCNYDMPFNNRVAESPTTDEVCEVLSRVALEREPDEEMMMKYREGNDITVYREKVARLLGIDAAKTAGRRGLVNVE